VPNERGVAAGIKYFARVTLSFMRRLFWPKGFPGMLSRVMGALSLFYIMTYGFNYGLGPMFKRLLEYYDSFLQALFGLAEPFIEASLMWVSTYIGWNLVLYPHWKHIFVLMGIYFFRLVGVNYAVGRRGTASFNLIWCLIVVLISSIAAGTVPVRNASMAANFLIAFIPIIGALVCTLVGFIWEATFHRKTYGGRDLNVTNPTWWEYFRWGLSRVLSRTLIAIAALWIGLQVPFIRDLESPGLAMLALLVIALAIYWLWDGVNEAKSIRKSSESTLEAYWRSEDTQLGVAMLGTFFWLALFVVLDAGLP
jgi:hypothetical protein